MNTDYAWEEWGRQDPYFGVITHPKFRREQLTQDAKDEFFESGRQHVEYVLQMIRHYIDPGFQPVSVLDFGCGVGRLVVPFARIAEIVVGLDVSSSMLLEAKKNCNEFAIDNVRLLLSDDKLSTLSGTYDLIHSFIVFQHIPQMRGREIFLTMLSYLSPGGIGAIQFCYAKERHAATFGVSPAPLLTGDAIGGRAMSIRQPGTDPEMQMNSYSLNELLFILQKAGVHRFHAEFTDHGGELGVFFFFQKPLLANL